MWDAPPAVLGSVGDGTGDDWARIRAAYETVTESVRIGNEAEANLAADLIAALAYAVVRGRARRLGAVLTALGDEMYGSRVYMHISVAVNALLTMVAMHHESGSGATTADAPVPKGDSFIEA